MIKINLNEEQVPSFIKVFKEYLALLIEGKLVERCPVDTSFLRTSINSAVEDDKIVISMAEYGKYIEFGTRPHIIRPVNGKALKFSIKGETIFAKQVVHPGTLPNPFIRTTFFRDMPELVEQAAMAALDSLGAQT